MVINRPNNFHLCEAEMKIFVRARTPLWGDWGEKHQKFHRMQPIDYRQRDLLGAFC